MQFWVEALVSPTEVLQIGNRLFFGWSSPTRKTLGNDQRRVVAQVMLNLPLVALILMPNLWGMDTGPVSLVYHGSVIVGCYLFPFFLVCSISTALFSMKRSLASGICLVILSSYIYFLLVDSVVFSIYKFHIDLFWLSFFIQDFSGLGISPTIVLVAALVFLMILMLEWKLSTFAPRLIRVRFLWQAFLIVAFAGLVISQVVHVVAYEKGDYRITQSTPLLPSYWPLHSHKYASKYGDFFDADGPINSHPGANNSTGLLHYPLAPICRDSSQQCSQPNIVLILLESWRADTMNDLVSPNIAALGRRSTVCLEHLSSGNSTVAGVFGLLYGIHPTYWDAVKANTTLIDNPLVFDILRDENYDMGVYARSNFKRHRIKDTIFRDIPIIEDFAGKTADSWDKDMTEKMMGFLDEHQDGKKPFFLFGFFKASHFSYFSDEEHKKFQPDPELLNTLVRNSIDSRSVMNDYRNSIFFDDDLVGRIIDRLDTTGLMDNTIVIITSDHAEEFNDNGEDYWGHGSNFTSWQTQVPMIIYFPGHESRLITARTSHLDIVPTLLHGYFGVTNQVSDYSDGVDLAGKVPLIRPMVQASYYNYAITMGDDVLVAQPWGLKQYNIKDITQPGGTLSDRLLPQVMKEVTRFYIPNGKGPSGGNSCSSQSSAREEKRIGL